MRLACTVFFPGLFEIDPGGFDPFYLFSTMGNETFEGNQRSMGLFGLETSSIMKEFMIDSDSRTE